MTLEEREKTVKSVRAEQIESISLEYGSHSHHPLIQMVFGVVLAAADLAGYEIRIGETARAHLDGRPER